VDTSRSTDHVAVAILAAGGSTRFGASTKLLVEHRGRPIVSYAIDSAVASGLRPVVLVTGNEGDSVSATAPADVRTVDNPRWHDGISTSLHTALDSLEADRDVDAVVIGLGDQPGIGAEAFRRVAAAYDDGARLAVATYDGQRGNPVLIARELWSDARTLTGDEGARQLMRRIVPTEVPCDGTGDPFDIDTAADLTELEHRWSTSPTASE
jgi:CTP:molybdopterin cytidylyltransferase MocA